MVSLEQPLLAVKQQKGRTPAIRYRPLRPGDFLAVKVRLAKRFQHAVLLQRHAWLMRAAVLIALQQYQPWDESRDITCYWVIDATTCLPDVISAMRVL